MSNIPLNIDWQQILLHFFNFSILVGGLYLLLFKPVKNFMDKRVKHYADMESAAQEREKRTAAAKEAESFAQQQRAAAQQQADKILTAARENAENDRKKIVAEANREAVSIAEDAMEKLLAAQTARAYDSFVNAAEGEERHEQ